MNSVRSLLYPFSNHLRLCSSRRISQTPMFDILPKEARVVICGSGIVGNSVAYHLVEKGWTDVVVIDQEDGIGKGTSVYGSGVLALLKPVEEQQIINKSIALYKKLEADGHEIGLSMCGSLYLAQNRERMVLFRRRAALNVPQGIDCKIIGPREIEQIHPLIYTNDLQGGIYVEADVVANPVLICHLLAELAQKGGAKYVKNCEFLNLSTENGRVSAVETSLGTIKCEYFVNCAGMWAWELGQRSSPKVRVPVHAAEHYYLLTESLQQSLPRVLPTIRDYDSGTYIRMLEDNSFIMGGFEEVAKPAFMKGIPKNWKDLLQSDWDHFAPLLDRCLHRAPALKECELKYLRNAPDNFTPDGKWILGETPEIDNYFVAAGMNGNSLQGAGGIGDSLACWITEGEADMCLLNFDVRRFIDVHNNRRFLCERVKEIVGKQFAILYPLQTEYKSARRIRCSPLYATLLNQGAVFGNIMSFERPLYFDLEYEPGKVSALPQGTYWKPLYFDNLKDEFKACREGVAVIDMSSFSKFQITSAKEEVVDFFQKICTNDVNVPVGHISPTGMLNERGGYENDCMLIREQQNSYFMVCPTRQQTRVAEWMERHVPKNGYVQFNDVTSMYTVLLIIGPKSRELLSQVIEDDIDLKMLPFTFQTVSLGYTPKSIKLLSVTNSGEIGYSLYIPSEYAVHVYDQLMKVGKDYGIKNAGYLTLRFLRLERFVPFWGEEIDSQTTPLEIGRLHRVKFDKGDFIGRAALKKQHEEGVYRRLVHFTMDDDHDPENDVWLWGGEPIFRNGVYVGATTSGGYGYTLERMVAMGFVVNKDKTGKLLPVTSDYILSRDALYQIDIAGRRHTVKQSLHPPRLPGGQVTQTKDYCPTLREKSILQAKQ